jgi:hypothetical protein
MQNYNVVTLIEAKFFVYLYGFLINHNKVKFLNLLFLKLM